MNYSCLTLLTDYGYSGGFAGVLHAVAFSIAPEVPVIDLDHGIPPQDVRLGALRLERLMDYTPTGVHVAVVDPGVGGPRRAVAIEAGGRVFVGPDNGLLVWAARRCGPIERVVALDEERFWLSPRSRTFDGRDIFVPVAAHIASGTALADVGSTVPATTLVELDRPAVVWGDDGSAVLEVVQVDGFGNIQLSGDAETAGRLGLERGGPVALQFGLRPELLAAFGETFGDAGDGEAVLLLDSDGALALSVNGGSASRMLALHGLAGGRRDPGVVIGPPAGGERVVVRAVAAGGGAASGS